jgi:hypothetical protein
VGREADPGFPAGRTEGSEGGWDGGWWRQREEGREEILLFWESGWKGSAFLFG